MQIKRIVNFVLTIVAFILFLVGFFFLIADFRVKLVYIILISLSGALFGISIVLTLIFNTIEQKNSNKAQIYLEHEREVFDSEIQTPLVVKKITVKPGTYIFAVTKDLKFKLVNSADFNIVYLISPSNFSEISFEKNTLTLKTQNSVNTLKLNKNIEDIRNTKSFNDFLYVLSHYNLI